MFYSGFQDVVFDSQYVFNALLKTTSFPGLVYDLDKKHLPSTWGEMHASTVAILLTVADKDTSFYTIAKFSDLKINHSLNFYIQAQHTDVQVADFLVTDASAFDELSCCKVGSEYSPEFSATLIIQIDAFQTGEFYRLTGPGILNEKQVQLPLDGRWLAFLKEKNSLFPMGVDCLITSPHQVMAIPRTTSVSKA